jgi:hypothetical protein
VSFIDIVMGTLPDDSAARSPRRSGFALLQSITLAWMLVECAVSLFAAARSHSPELLAFGVDSFVERLSASVVVLALVPRFSFRTARRSLEGERSADIRLGRPWVQPEYIRALEPSRRL